MIATLLCSQAITYSSFKLWLIHMWRLGFDTLVVHIINISKWMTHDYTITSSRHLGYHVYRWCLDLWGLPLFQTYYILKWRQCRYKGHCAVSYIRFDSRNYLMKHISLICLTYVYMAYISAIYVTLHDKRIHIIFANVQKQTKSWKAVNSLRLYYATKKVAVYNWWQTFQ